MKKNIKLNSFIASTITEYLNESKSYPFNLTVKEKMDKGYKYYER